MNLAAILPMAFVMIAGPQIISAIFLATTDDWRRTSAAYVGGAALSITTIATTAYFLSKGIKNSSSSSSKGSTQNWIDIVVIALLVFAMFYVFLKKRDADPPSWMGKLQDATPKFAFTLGFLLLGVFPTDLVTSTAAGTRLGNHGDAWWQLLPFIALTLLFLALPSLARAAFGSRAERFLPKARDWMNTNSWVVSEVVIVFFIVLQASSL